MREMQLREVKATLSNVVDRALAGEAAIITRHGKKEAVLLSWADYQRLSSPPSLGWLLTHSPLDDEDLPERKSARALREEIR